MRSRRGGRFVVFGSFVTGRMGHDSDRDVMIDFPEARLRRARRGRGDAPAVTDARRLDGEDDLTAAIRHFRNAPCGPHPPGVPPGDAPPSAPRRRSRRPASACSGTGSIPRRGPAEAATPHPNTCPPLIRRPTGWPAA
ncbi:nucleotidyltransferase domain-containing protein [Methylobacterium sp. J-076]|uniref:nucleotidyltransferase domain-containing protein n=1 Tax=Methylobacterium sp. J-076 TaxID=2836655 RepID=UPI00391BEA84